MISKVFCALFISHAALVANVSINKLFTSHMVLQRDKPVHVYGIGTNGESLTVTLGGQSKKTTVTGGKWSVYLDPMPFNKTGQDMTIQGTNTITLNEILVGDVWVLGGQSNMHRGIKQYTDLSPDTINNPLIRMIVMEFNPPEPDGPSDEIKFGYGATKWEPATYGAGGATASMVENVSAPGIYFALELQAKLGIPIGLVGAYRGATRAECWTPLATLQAHPELKYYLDNVIPDDITKTHSWLYNAVIHPITPFSIKGVLWYQGESNTDRPREHGYLFPRMIEAWRAAFNQGDFPFIFAQLASFMPVNLDLSGGLAWAYNKMAQTRGLTQPNTGMITLHDVGEYEDIHPQDKPTVGYRFAMKARELVYGEDIVGSGPVIGGYTKEGNKIRVHFTNTGAGLETRAVSMKDNQQGPPFNYFTTTADTLHGFEIAGADKIYHDAFAVIEGTTVVVSSPKVSSPNHVRYAFRSFTLANLYNKEGFPAEQFYTDNYDWPQFTAGYQSHPDPGWFSIPQVVGIKALENPQHIHLEGQGNATRFSLSTDNSSSILRISDIRGRKVAYQNGIRMPGGIYLFTLVDKKSGEN